MRIAEHAPIAAPTTPTFAPASSSTMSLQTVRPVAQLSNDDGVNHIVVTDARNGKVLATTPGSPDSAAVDAAKNANIVLDFYRNELHRNSIDGHGMTIQLKVHDKDAGPGNAFWDGKGISIGDGDNKDFKTLAGSLDALGHELTHGVNAFSNHLKYQSQSGALDESFADVMGESAQIWHEHPNDFDSVQVAQQHDWSSGEDGVMGPRYNAISDLGHPGRAKLVMNQPDNMKHFLKTWEDNGGVHTNSGIPSKAAYEAAQRIGTEKMAKIWYDTMLHGMSQNSTFADAAKSTIQGALNLYGQDVSNSVRDAWAAVGL